MDQAHGLQPPSVGKTVVGLLIIVALAGTLTFALWPRGEKVGVIQLATGSGSLAVERRQGSSLLFRLDLEDGGRVVQRHLEKSTVTVELEEDGKRTGTSTCPAYSGRAAAGGKTGMSGIVLDCRLPMHGAGSANVHARVSWEPGFNPKGAVLEVRREGP